MGPGAFMRLLQRPELTGCLSHEGSAGKLGCVTFDDLRCALSVAFVQDAKACARRRPVISVEKGF